MAAPSERLPWLNEGPPAGSVIASRRTPADSMWPWYLLLFLLVAAVAAGAWWLRTGKEARAPVLPAEESVPIPIVRGEEPQATLPEQAAPQSESARTAEVDAPVSQALEDAPSATAQSRQAPRVTEATPSRRAVIPVDEPESAPPMTGPTPIILHHPQPNRGRVVQLGSFPTRPQAEESWKRITRRYPYLATRSKMINTVDVRGLGGGRPTRMYRLQLGTSSQAQSVVICQQLERAGHSCVVVY